MQFQLAGERQTALSHHPPLALAEVPSTFAEMIVTDRLLAAAATTRRCASGCSRAASRRRSRRSSGRRTWCATSRAPTACAPRARRSCPTASREVWLETNRPYYGDAVELPDGYRFGWAYIPHFIHTRFYTYAYVFAHLASLALYAKLPRGRRRVRRPVPRLPLDRRRGLAPGAARRASASTSRATTAGTRGSPRSSG